MDYVLQGIACRHSILPKDHIFKRGFGIPPQFWDRYHCMCLQEWDNCDTWVLHQYIYPAKACLGEV